MSDSKTENLLQRWESTVKSAARYRQEMNALERASANAANELGKWLCPRDAKDGEVFGIWVAGRILEITKVDLHTYNLRFRANGKVYEGEIQTHGNATAV